MNEKYELVRFEQSGLTLDVNVSPSEDTVWLSKEQIGQLYGRDRSVISRHINSLYEEGELDRKSTCAKNAHIPSKRNRLYDTELYNLDVIISVGYRVKSQNGVLFRRWAIGVLKEYLLRGYAVDKNRTLVTNENYMNLINRVESIDTRLSKIEEEHVTDREKVFFNGEYLDARAFIKQLISEAKACVFIVDPYADAKALDYLSAKGDDVAVSLVTSSQAKLTQDDVKAFNLQYGGLVIKIDDTFHDRFIAIDERCLYHLGASLNYAGRKTFAIAKLSDELLVASVITRIQAICEAANDK